MKACFLVTAGIAILASFSAEGAIHYEFQQVKSSSTPGSKPVVLIGTATIDGVKSRVNVQEGSSSGVGRYIVTTNGGLDYSVVDPESESYIVRQRGEAARGVQALGVQIDKMKIDQEYLGSGPKIAGYPTEHYKLTANYDVSISFGGFDLKQHVVATIEKYTTLAFGDVAPTFFESTPSTGNAEIDKLIEAETTKVPGFPLKQRISIVSTLDERALPRASMIEVAPSRQRVTELTVSSIGRVDPDPASFRVPVRFQRVDGASSTGY